MLLHRLLAPQQLSESAIDDLLQGIGIPYYFPVAAQLSARAKAQPMEGP